MKVQFAPGANHLLSSVLSWMCRQPLLKIICVQLLHAWSVAVDAFFSILWPLAGLSTAPEHQPGERAIGACKRAVATDLVRDKVSGRPYKLARIANALGRGISTHAPQADRDEAWSYWMAARREMSTAKHFCITHDGSNVGKRGRIFAAVMNIDTGGAAFAPPQVHKGCNIGSERTRNNVMMKKNQNHYEIEEPCHTHWYLRGVCLFPGKEPCDVV